jgi:hypothetical protein
VNVFDFVSAINSTQKTNLIKDEYTEKEYIPFIVNKTFSYFPDAIMYSNAMNFHNHLNNKLQFDYLLNSLRPAKRFTKWVKKYDSDDLEAVKTYYEFNTKKAQEALNILSSEQIKIIKKHLQEGGMDDDKS